MATDAEEKAEHGRKLVAAMAARGVKPPDLAIALGVSQRTVGNWRNGKTMPNETDLNRLERVLGAYNASGDPVEVAIKRSELAQWRQTDVISRYQRHLDEQRKEATG